MDVADVATNYVNAAGVSAGTIDTDVTIEGAASLGAVLDDGLDGVLFRHPTAAQDWSNNHFYIWINCGIVGILDTIAAGGFRIRFAGDTITDFFEVYVGGSDSWPTSIEGGWTQFVIDIEAAQASPDNTGGTPPATTAIRHIGWVGITDGTMPKMVDNTWIDQIARLPDGSPGIIIQGRNGGSTDWTFDDIVTQLTSAVGTFVNGPGGSFVCRTSIRWGANDSVAHAFTDTNKIILFDDQPFMAADLYFLEALGNSGGSTNLTLGVKTGTGDDATGAQGVIFSAASGGVRFDLNFDDPDLDGINFYGCTLIHGGAMQLDDPAVSFISTSFIDCDSALVSNSEMLRVTVIDANTADGVAFMTTDDLTDIVFSTFEFSDGHAIELTTPIVSAQTNKGNTFTGYGASDTNDAAIYNNSAGLVTIGNSENAAEPTRRNGTSASTVFETFVTLTVTVRDEAGVPVENAQVGIFRDSDNTEILNVDTDAQGVAQLTTFDFTGDEDVTVRVRKGSGAA